MVAICLLLLSSVGNAPAQGPLEQAQERYYRRDFKGALSLLDARSTDSSTQFLMARILVDSGDPKRASDILAKLTSQNQHSSEYFDWLGKAYGKRAEEANPFSAAALAGKARAAFERAVELDGKNKDALSDLFEYYFEAPGIMGGGVDKAAAIADRTAAVDPIESLQEKALLAQKRHDTGQAERLLRKAIQMKPDATGSYVALAKLLNEEGKTTEVDAVLDQGLMVQPGKPQLILVKARLLIKGKRNLDEAQKLLDQFARLPLTVDDPSREEGNKLRRELQQLKS